MRQLLDLVYEYQQLRMKEATLGVPLQEFEATRREGLARLLRGDRAADDRRAFPRIPLPLRVSFTRPGGFEVGEILDLSAGGFRIAAARPPGPGTRVVVHIPGSEGQEYVFPGRVVWRRTEGASTIGVAIAGVPRRSWPEDGEIRTGVWRRGHRGAAEGNKGGAAVA